MVSTHGCQLSNFSWNRTYDQRFTESRTQPRMSECLRKEEVLQRVLKFIEAFSKKRQTPAWQTSNVNTWSSQVPLDASDTRTLHQWGWQLWRCPLASWQWQFLSPCQQQTSIHIPFKDCPSSKLLTNSVQKGAAASIMALNSQMKIMLNWILKTKTSKNVLLFIQKCKLVFIPHRLFARNFNFWSVRVKEIFYFYFWVSRLKWMGTWSLNFTPNIVA